MKYTIQYFLAFLACVGLLSGCSIDGLRGSLDDANQGLVDGGDPQIGDITTYLNKTQTALDLSGLSLSNIPDLCALLPLEIQSQLMQVNLSNNNIQEVNQDLSCLQNLKGIDLSFNQITELVGLGSLPNLLDLRLAKNSIKTFEAEFFSHFPALQGLKLGYNKLKDTTALQELKSLIRLELQHNELISLVGLENLEKLEKIKVEFNELKEDQLTHLETLNQLKSITGGYNKFKDELLDKRNSISAK